MSSRVRPYSVRETPIKGTRGKVWRERVYHSMAHLQDHAGAPLVCGFDDFAGVVPDGYGDPGYARHLCEDCARMADHTTERRAWDDLIESLPYHQTEETTR